MALCECLDMQMTLIKFTEQLKTYQVSFCMYKTYYTRRLEYQREKNHYKSFMAQKLGVQERLKENKYSALRIEF